MSAFQSTTYEPPYESPMEDLFALNLDKYLAEGVNVTKQTEVQTFCGMYRLDFVASLAGHPKVAFECDGKDYHDQSRDEWRDALILDAANIKAIYRFPDAALFYHTEDCIYLLSRWEPHLFSDRGHANLGRLASQAAQNAGENPDFGGAMLFYHDPDGSSETFVTKIERHVIAPPPGCRSFLKDILAFAKRSGLADLDEIRARHLKGWLGD